MDGVPFDAPDDFRARIAATFGDAGVRWLERLPEVLQACADLWSLTLERPFPLSYNYVAPATQADGTRVVLKAGCQNPELTTEAEALQLFAGEHMCALLQYSAAHGAMLLERVEPGIPLASVAMEDDERATRIAIELLQRLWRPVPEEHLFPTVADWAKGIALYRERFNAGSGPLPERLLRQAEESFDWLLASTEQPMLLHGDFHHDNVLSAADGRWLIIDPKGVIGDPGYDLGAFLYNPMPGLLSMPTPEKIIARRIDQLVEGLGMDRERIRRWGLAQAVLSACWSISDGQDWQHSIACAEHLSELEI